MCEWGGEHFLQCVYRELLLGGCSSLLQLSISIPLFFIGISAEISGEAVKLDVWHGFHGSNSGAWV